MIQIIHCGQMDVLHYDQYIARLVYLLLFEHFIHFAINLSSQIQRHVSILLFKYIDADVMNNTVNS